MSRCVIPQAAGAFGGAASLGPSVGPGTSVVAASAPGGPLSNFGGPSAHTTRPRGIMGIGRQRAASLGDIESHWESGLEWLRLIGLMYQALFVGHPAPSVRTPAPASTGMWGTEGFLLCTHYSGTYIALWAEWESGVCFANLKWIHQRPWLGARGEEGRAGNRSRNRL